MNSQTTQKWILWIFLPMPPMLNNKYRASIGSLNFWILNYVFFSTSLEAGDICSLGSVSWTIILIPAQRSFVLRSEEKSSLRRFVIICTKVVLVMYTLITWYRTFSSDIVSCHWVCNPPIYIINGFLALTQTPRSMCRFPYKLFKLYCSSGARVARNLVLHCSEDLYLNLTGIQISSTGMHESCFAAIRKNLPN